MLSIVGILLSLAALMYFAYRGFSVLLLAPLAALAAVAFSGAPLLASYTQVFMEALGGFVILYFPLFLLGAVFGKLMEASGAARALAAAIVARLGAGRAVSAIVAACALLTYGGVSLFVVAFAVYPIAAELFRAANVPKRLIPATIALGAFTFTMTALPGTPAIQNAIPMPFFGTTPFAAPGIGILAALVMFGAGQWWLRRRAAAARARGEGYGQHADALPQPDKEMRERAAGEGFDVVEIAPDPMRRAPPFALALLPVVVVIAANLVFSSFVIPAWDVGFLAEPRFGSVGLSSVLGVWSIILALSLAILVLVAANWLRLTSLKRSLDDGANASVLPIFNTASLVGFGAVVAALPASDIVREGVLGLGGDNPLVSLAVAVNILAGITGSASGGMSIALSTLGATYLELATAAGISPEALHRITAIATGGLDSLPHNGAVVTLLAICGLTHRQAYGDLAMVAVVFPIAALALAIAAASLIGTF